MTRAKTIGCAITVGFLSIPLISSAQDAPDLPPVNGLGVNATAVPRDISSQYSFVTERGIPVIENPSRCDADGLDLRIRVSKFEHLKGFVVADLHDDNEENFLDGEKVVLRVLAEVSNETIFFCLPLTKPGQYAVALYHDANNNRAFDKGFLRIPRERFGMSNNPVFGLGTPDFEEAAIIVGPEGRDLTITLIGSGDILKGQRR